MIAYGPIWLDYKNEVLVFDLPGNREHSAIVEYLFEQFRRFCALTNN